MSGQVTDEVLMEAAEWAANIYEHRTRDVAAGIASIHYAHPAYRVDWSDVLRKFPSLEGPYGRVEYQKPWERAIKKRGLWKVLQGKMTAVEWVAIHTEK